MHLSTRVDISKYSNDAAVFVDPLDYFVSSETLLLSNICACPKLVLFLLIKTQLIKCYSSMCSITTWKEFRNPGGSLARFEPVRSMSAWDVSPKTHACAAGW